MTGLLVGVLLVGIAGLLIGVRAAVATLRNHAERVEAWLALGEPPEVAVRRSGASPMSPTTRAGTLGVAGGWVASVYACDLALSGGAFERVIVLAGGCGLLVATVSVGVRFVAQRHVGEGRMPDVLPDEAKAAFREDSVPKRPVRGRDA